MPSYMVHKRFKNIIIWTSNYIKREYYSKMERATVRWAFNAKNWNPTLDQLNVISSYIQEEEKERISKFVFIDDAKSSLIGRLMLRKYVHLATNMPYEEIRFSRDDRGKPYLVGVGDVPVNFNISHQGDYVVLGGSSGVIGIDVMKIEAPANKNIPEFFRLMSRQFSKQEWDKIHSFATEPEQIACFYRFWCLKESYAKNIGLGVTINFSEVSFALKSGLEVGKITTDTKLYLKNEKKEDWYIEESLLDDKHAVAVCLREEKYSKGPYHFLTFDELVNEAKPLFNTDKNFSEMFLKKESKRF